MTVDQAPITPAVSCSDGSTAAREPLAGTATEGARWLILEWRGAWGRDAVADTRLPRRGARGAGELRRPRAPRAPARPAWDGDGRLPGRDDRGRRPARAADARRARCAGRPGRRGRGRAGDVTAASRLRARPPRRLLREARNTRLRLVLPARRPCAALAVVASRRTSLRRQRARRSRPASSSGA